MSAAEKAAVERFVATTLTTIAEGEECEPAALIVGLLAVAAELALKDGTARAERMSDYARAFADVAATFTQAAARPRKAEHTH